MAALRTMGTASPADIRLADRVEAEAYVASVCFKHGPPRLLGVELEWTVHHADDPRRPLDAGTLRQALGRHAPAALFPGSPQDAPAPTPLPQGSLVTVEPGGQVEISSAPSDSLQSLISATSADVARLTELLGPAGLELGDRGIDPYRPPTRVLDVPRYSAMETAFDRIGAHGRTMMCSTAGVQVCVDAGEPDQLPVRWAALHAVGPVMIAAFANSGERLGRSTGWASARTRAQLGTDPARSWPSVLDGDPVLGWARRVLDMPLICWRRPGDCWEVPAGISFADWIGGALAPAPTFGDLDYHLSTVFTPVRAHGYLEIRFLDAQSGDEWIVPTVLLAALFARQSTVERLLELAKPAVGKWLLAARRGLADPGLATTAAAVLDLALRALGDTDVTPEIERYVGEVTARRLAGTIGGIPKQGGSA